MRLADLQYQLEQASRRVHAICESVDDHAFGRRPRPESWSIAECIDHLNLTTKSFLPLIDGALASGTKRKVTGSHQYHKDLTGWLLCWFLEPPFRVKVKTSPPFEPVRTADKLSLLDEFDMRQDELARRIHQSIERDLERLKITSPFSSRVTYNLFSGFCALLAHQRRHLWQAERIAGQTGAKSIQSSTG
jgi:DinB superfamily